MKRLFLSCLCFSPLGRQLRTTPLLRPAVSPTPRIIRATLLCLRPTFYEQDSRPAHFGVRRTSTTNLTLYFITNNQPAFFFVSRVGILFVFFARETEGRSSFFAGESEGRSSFLARETRGRTSFCWISAFKNGGK